MNFGLKDILWRIAQYVVFGNIIIALASVALLFSTYIELNIPIRVDALAGIVFFSTFFLYSVHRLMGINRIRKEDHGPITGWAASHKFSLLLFAIVGAGGVAFFVFQMKATIVALLAVLAVISTVYELPVIRHNKIQIRLRNLWQMKIILITGVWITTTVILPVMNAGVTLYSIQVWMIVSERMLFILLLALCFDERDMRFDKAEGLRTIPIILGRQRTMELYKILTVLFAVLVISNHILIFSNWLVAIALLLSVLVTYRIIARTDPGRSDYYYLLLVDSMMILQFLLLCSGQFISALIA